MLEGLRSVEKHTQKYRTTCKNVIKINLNNIENFENCLGIHQKKDGTQNRKSIEITQLKV